MRRYECVIFDWDGTLIDSERRIVLSVQFAAASQGLPVLAYEETKQIIGLSLTSALQTLYPMATEAQVLAMSQSYTLHFLEQSDTPMQPFDGAELMLKSLKNAGMKLAVATGKSRRGLNEVLEVMGFAHLFDLTRTPDESASKPDPLMLTQILTHFNLDVSQALMVGDTEFDLQMAHLLGMDSVAMGHGVHEVARLQKWSPVAVCDNLHQLKDWLLNPEAPL